MKIAIIGYSGSGKSTLAKILGQKFLVPVLHLDTVHWLPGWKENDTSREIDTVNKFLSENESWVIDGNYKKLEFERRMNLADVIIFMSFGRISTLIRVIKRYKQYKGKTRDSMTVGCNEKIDFEFIRWVLFTGRSRKRRKIYRDVLTKYKTKTVIIKNQKALDNFIFQLRNIDKT